MTPIKCAACQRKAVQGRKYCLYHDQAFQNMMAHYKVWANAYGIISMEDFMNKLSIMKETGNWIREVISIELQSKK